MPCQLRQAVTKGDISYKIRTEYQGRTRKGTFSSSGVFPTFSWNMEAIPRVLILFRWCNTT